MEGSGKVRVFAIANPLFQARVRPLHDWVMNVLRRLPHIDWAGHITKPRPRSK